MQALCEELTRKAADLAWENENLKRVGGHENDSIFFFAPPQNTKKKTDLYSLTFCLP